MSGPELTYVMNGTSYVTLLGVESRSRVWQVSLPRPSLRSFKNRQSSKSPAGSSSFAIAAARAATSGRCPLEPLPKQYGADSRPLIAIKRAIERSLSTLRAVTRPLLFAQEHPAGLRPAVMPPVSDAPSAKAGCQFSASYERSMSEPRSGARPQSSRLVRR